MKTIATLIVLFAMHAAASGAETAFVTRVIDGDTIELEDGRRVRLRGIDAPELRDTYGDIAKRKMELYTLDRRVTLHNPVPAAYGRIEATVQWSTRDVGALMLLHGHATHWERYTRGEQRDRYRNCQSIAREHSRGLWAGAVADVTVPVREPLALFPPHVATVASPTTRVIEQPLQSRSVVPQGQVIYYSMPQQSGARVFLPSMRRGAVCTGPNCQQ